METAARITSSPNSSHPPDEISYPGQARARPDLDDGELARRIHIHLANRLYHASPRLNVGAHNGNVTISGQLDSFYDKQVALNSCQRVAGVIKLIDQITVSKPSLLPERGRKPK